MRIFAMSHSLSISSIQIKKDLISRLQPKEEIINSSGFEYHPPLSRINLGNMPLLPLFAYLSMKSTSSPAESSKNGVVVVVVEVEDVKVVIEVEVDVILG